jgi:hypothetical protein
MLLSASSVVSVSSASQFYPGGRGTFSPTSLNDCDADDADKTDDADGN